MIGKIVGNRNSEAKRFHGATLLRRVLNRVCFDRCSGIDVTAAMTFRVELQIAIHVYTYIMVIAADRTNTYIVTEARQRFISLPYDQNSRGRVDLSPPRPYGAEGCGLPVVSRPAVNYGNRARTSADSCGSADAVAREMTRRTRDDSCTWPTVKRREKVRKTIRKSSWRKT